VGLLVQERIIHSLRLEAAFCHRKTTMDNFIGL
jgi:hypothetical protein